MHEDITSILRSEVVVLPFLTVETLYLAARHFAEQFHVPVRIEIRGHVAAERNLYCLLQEWTHIGALDRELGLVALGEPGEDEAVMLWLRLVGPGQIRLSAFPS